MLREILADPLRGARAPDSGTESGRDSPVDPARPVGTDLQGEEAAGAGAALGPTSSCGCGSCDVGNRFEADSRQGGARTQGRD